MAKLDLTKYGITGTTEIVYNPSYEELFAVQKMIIAEDCYDKHKHL